MASKIGLGKIASYIIKLVVVLTVVHLFTLYSHTTGMSNLENINLLVMWLWCRWCTSEEVLTENIGCIHSART